MGHFSNCRSRERGWPSSTAEYGSSVPVSPRRFAWSTFWFWPLPNCWPAEPDRVVAAVVEGPHPQTVEEPTPSADATLHSRPACTGKYGWARALGCDGEWGESVDPIPSDCETPALLGPDSCSRGPHPPPRTAPPVHWCGSHKSHPTWLPAQWFPPVAPNSAGPLRSWVRNAWPFCNAPAPCPPSNRWWSPTAASSSVAPLLSRSPSEPFASLPTTPP